MLCCAIRCEFCKWNNNRDVATLLLLPTGELLPLEKGLQLGQGGEPCCESCAAAGELEERIDMDREQLHVQAEQKMKQPDITGDAWLYIYELTGPANAEKSRSWLRTRLIQAENDYRIPAPRRAIYAQCLETLD